MCVAMALESSEELYLQDETLTVKAPVIGIFLAVYACESRRIFQID